MSSRIYVSDILRIYAIRCGLECDRYYDYIAGNVAEKPEETAETQRNAVFAEFERLGGGKRAN